MFLIISHWWDLNHIKKVDQTVGFFLEFNNLIENEVIGYEM